MRTSMFGMFWRRMIPGVVAVVVLAVIGGTAERQITAAARQVALVAAIEESPTTVGLADSNLSRLGTHEAIDEQLKMMHDIGIQNVRIGISWATLQLTDGGNYNWALTDYDYVVDRAAHYGMGVLAVLHETPGWAGDKILSGMPDDVTKFGDFVQEVATHFDDRISAYEVWNEPNATFFLDPVSPENYTRLLIEAYDRIKAVDENSTVIGGVLGFGFTITAPDGSLRTMNPVDFLEGMYAAGAKGKFDALSFHPYKPDIKFSDQTGVLTPRFVLAELRALMALHGDEGLKIWATEYGLPTPALDPSDPGYISPDKQAEFIKDFLENWGKEDGTGPIFIYTTRDLATGSTEEQDTYGIWETDWTPKPAVQVIKDFIASQKGNPIIDFIRNAIVNLAKITGAVVKGIVNVTVGIVNALVDATVWVVKTIAKVAGAVVQGIVDVTKRVATAICNTVHAVVDRIQDFVHRDDPISTPVSVTGARSLRTAAAALVTTAAEVGTAAVSKDRESATGAADSAKVGDVAADGETTRTVATDTVEDTKTVEATTEVKPAARTSATETSTAHTPTPVVTAPGTEMASVAPTSTKESVGTDATQSATKPSKTEITAKDDDAVAERDDDQVTKKADTEKAGTSTKVNTTTTTGSTSGAGSGSAGPESSSAAAKTGTDSGE